MISVKVDFTDFNKSIQNLVNYHKNFFTKLAIETSRKIVMGLVDRTRIGDKQSLLSVEAYIRFYEGRQSEKGYDIRVGLARGSWITELNTVTNEGAVFYDENNQGIAITRVFDTEMRNFKLGDTINIHNSLDYIKSEQAEGDVAIAEVFAKSAQIVNRAMNKVVREEVKQIVKNVRGK